MILSQKKPVRSTSGSMIELSDADLLVADLPDHDPHLGAFEVDLIEVEDGFGSHPTPIFSTSTLRAAAPLGRAPMLRPSTPNAFSASLCARPDLERSHMFQRPAAFTPNHERVSAWLSALESHQGPGRLSFLDLGIWFKVCDGHIQSGPVRHARLAFEVGDGAQVRARVRALAVDTTAELSALDEVTRQSPDLVLRWAASALLTLTRWTDKAPVLLSYGVQHVDNQTPSWSSQDILRLWQRTSPTIARPSTSPPTQLTPLTPSNPLPAIAAPAPAPSLSAAEAAPAEWHALFASLAPQATLALCWVQGRLSPPQSPDPALLDEALALAVDAVPSLRDPQLGGRALGGGPKTLLWIAEDGFWLGLFHTQWAAMLRLPNARMGSVLNQLKAL